LTLLLAVLSPQVQGQVAGDIFTAGRIDVRDADGVRMEFPYRWCAPQTPKEGQRYPLLVFLHGAGERGRDNQAQLRHLPEKWNSLEHRLAYPCYLLAVQCPRKRMWVEVEWSDPESTAMKAEPTPVLAAVVRAMDQIIASEPVDQERVYLTGLSMGGFGSWDLAQRMPDRFAAVAPICGGGDERQASRLVPVPVWAYHGARDRVVSPARSRRMVAAIRRAGGSPLYTELEGVGHASWESAYAEGGVIRWMFRHALKKGNPPEGKLVLGSGSAPETSYRKPLAANTILFDDTVGQATTVRAPAISLSKGARVTYAANDRALDQTIHADLHLQGAAVLANGNSRSHQGHRLVIDGAIHGTGPLAIRAAYDGAIVLKGDSSTSFKGTMAIESGRMVLSKPARIGKVYLEVGGGGVRAALRLEHDDAIDDRARLTFRGAGGGFLDLACGHERIASVALDGDGVIRLADGPCILEFGESRQAAWKAGTQLIIENWGGNLAGGGADRIVFGPRTDALSDRFVAQIGFRNPQGCDPGLYRARTLRTGEIVPGAVVQPSRLPSFPVDDAARRRRTRICEVDGMKELARLLASRTAGLRVSFFGDSITWQDRFISKIRRAVGETAAGASRPVEMLNRGINGGGVRDLRDGSKRHARRGRDGDVPQAGFAEVLARDRPHVVAIFIGINDVNWKGTTNVQFGEALSELAAASRKAQVALVIATPFLDGELPDGENEDDARIEEIAEITRGVARRTGSVLVDLRHAAIAWLRNHNAELRLDGTFGHRPSGLLTYDKIHPSDRGNELIANHLAAGIARALKAR
jgi:poly(3-hydroxybutyrate) depolymerase/lysophospholipase L1-like esterase